MSLQDAVERALPGFRADALSRMTSTCTIRRAGTPTAGANGFDVTPYTDKYSGPCRVAGSAGGAAGARREEIANGVEVQAALRVLHLPAGTTGLRDGDLAEVTAGDTSGLVLRLVDTQWQDQSTALRVSCVEVSRPGEWG